ncbi:hypothetical protein [Actinoplanes couchii]|uniref:Integral membrane protein n=1 Tax=Actinoplanes couchii TaxID=403638 RepID=A0ABQ3XMU5_9ACTN|nr:hypothetical protein [Actinoplanes couchii]MDR6317834.1 hypothetical protein [Actinoplanes couchii]GID59821.1 hypothetical protein Aco03nite_082250 [Actinoplanes couchii]
MVTKRGLRFQVAAAVLVAALSALAWFGWLGWDTEYQFDAATNSYSGPYEIWQVVGCGLSLVILLVGALLAGTREVAAAAALTVGFTVAWTIGAARTDQTGLFAVGAVMVFLGLAAASGLIAAIMFGIRDRRSPGAG